MSNKFKISTARLAAIIKEEYASILEEIKDPTRVVEAAKQPTAPASIPPRKAQPSQKEGVDSLRDLIRKELESL
tara:strand:- start:933 stop:1154 length:222 start_codon:yes stop_codon:yes gene_type:complete